MANQRSDGPVAEFCAELRRLQESCGLDRAELARQLRYSRSQLYLILDGGIRRPPEWDRLVEPLVRACTHNDEREVAYWRRRHGVLVNGYSELRRQVRPDSKPPAGPPRMVPAQLPADVDVFTGRARELAELDRLLEGSLYQSATASRRSTAVVISAVSGTAGVGKTALALRWAHRVRRYFPDGQLYVNLRGYDADRPVAVGYALAGFLRALGLPGQDIPLDVDERAASYRSLLDGRRMLVVLDNAATVEQVRPLLPGAGSCLVVVTSRDSLAGLVARNGARRLDLDLLPPEEAVSLLGALIGGRVQTEPQAAATLAGQCAWLPLALRVAAELAAARPAISLTELVDELADERKRLDLLDAGGDPRTAVRGVFSWSYRHLPAEAARAFRLIGSHPGPDLDPYAAAALTAAGRDHAQRLLDLLARAHLLVPTRPGRYSMHDLLRAYATQLAAEDPDQEVQAALTRLFDHYLGTAAAAMDTCVPAERHRRPRVPVPAALTPPVADPTTARAWLDAERASLTAACTYTAIHGWFGHTIRLSSILFRYLDTGGHYSDALTINTHALHAARHTADLAAEAHALTNLGVVYQHRGQNQEAAEHHQPALVLFREIPDQAGEARVLDNLGSVYSRQGRYEQAAEHYQQALVLFREIYDRTGEARALGNLGGVYARQGRYEQAAEHHRQALDLARDIGHRAGEARALDNLGGVCSRQGRYEQAAEHHRQALDLARDIGDRVIEAAALINLGAVHGRQGRYEQAAEHHQQALTVFSAIGDRGGEAEALNWVGETYHATGSFRDARIQHIAALTLATQIGDRYEQARAHNGLACIDHATGDPGQARHHWCEAFALYTDLGVPDAHEAHARLAALDHEADEI